MEDIYVENALRENMTKEEFFEKIRSFDALETHWAMLLEGVRLGFIDEPFYLEGRSIIESNLKQLLGQDALTYFQLNNDGKISPVEMAES